MVSSRWCTAVVTVGVVAVIVGAVAACALRSRPTRLSAPLFIVGLPRSGTTTASAMVRGAVHEFEHCRSCAALVQYRKGDLAPAAFRRGWEERAARLGNRPEANPLFSAMLPELVAWYPGARMVFTSRALAPWLESLCTLYYMLDALGDAPILAAFELEFCGGSRRLSLARAALVHARFAADARRLAARFGGTVVDVTDLAHSADVMSSVLGVAVQPAPPQNALPKIPWLRGTSLTSHGRAERAVVRVKQRCGGGGAKELTVDAEEALRTFGGRIVYDL